jgi:glycosyltransferase involved in cell wall biosynthesis
VRQIKLLLVSPCFGTYGGIEAFMLAVADAVRREPDFTVKICFKKVKGFSLHPGLAAMLRHESVLFVDRAGKELANAIKWSDIVHLQNASPDVVALAKFFGKRIVMTIHNYMRDEWSLHGFLWRVSAMLADARWYNSEFVWQTWEGNRRRRRSKRVPTVSRLPSGWTPPNQRRGFVFAGRWIANKGIETLIEAYSLANLDRSAWPLTLIGDGPLRLPLQKKLEKEQIRGLEITGFVDDDVKAERMKKALWVVVPPNTREDLGLTAIEARSLGVPCIITRDGGLPEAAGRQALVCEPGDPQALKTLLEQAAAMDETEYAHRAERTKEELKDELLPLEFYPRAYRRVLTGQPVD